MNRASSRPPSTPAHRADGSVAHRALSAHLPARVLLAAAVVTLVVVVTAVVALVAGGGSSSGRAAPEKSTTRPASRTTDVAALPASAVNWLRTALPAGTTVLADPAAARQLAGSGLRVVTPASARGPVGFVVDTAALRAQRSRYPAVASALTTSVPVATVATGDAAAEITQIRQVSAVTGDQLRKEAALRKEAEAQLLANPAVRPSAAVTAVLRSGGLDLRAATVLALLAADGPVQLTAVTLDPAERAAGRPARSVDVRVDTARLRAVLAGVTGRYRLASNTDAGDGARRLTWPVDVDPVTT